MIVSLVIIVVAPARDLGQLHLGDARGRGHAHRPTMGQVFGTQIPHTLPEPGAICGLVFPVVRAPFVALLVSALRVRHDDLARLVTAAARAVFLPPIARPADRQQLLAAGAREEPVIEHDLERADFLPWLSSRARLRAVDATSHDKEGRELQLLAFVLSARTAPS
ncbi:MAG: hypothetical protein ACRENE_33690 [Polyangiaceae bacterium]